MGSGFSYVGRFSEYFLYKNRASLCPSQMTETSGCHCPRLLSVPPLSCWGSELPWLFYNAINTCTLSLRVRYTPVLYQHSGEKKSCYVETVSPYWFGTEVLRVPSRVAKVWLYTQANATRDDWSKESFWDCLEFWGLPNWVWGIPRQKGKMESKLSCLPQAPQFESLKSAQCIAWTWTALTVEGVSSALGPLQLPCIPVWATNFFIHLLCE